MDRSSDSESDASFPEVLSRDQIGNLDSEDVLTRHHGNHDNNVDQRFNELNRQIGDLTSIVLTLTNQIASINGEGNRPNIATTSANSRSDTRFIHSRALVKWTKRPSSASSSQFWLRRTSLVFCL